MAYKAHKLLEGYEKANSDNLPEVNIIALANFIAKDSNFISPEISNTKAMRNGRESYGESAIGYVQLKQEGHITTVLSCVAPEHKVTSNGYKVEIIVDSSKGKITSCKCYGCIAALGGCKHQLALLGWMHRRFEGGRTTSHPFSVFFSGWFLQTTYSSSYTYFLFLLYFTSKIFYQNELYGFPDV